MTAEINQSVSCRMKKKLQTILLDLGQQRTYLLEQRTILLEERTILLEQRTVLLEQR